MKNSNIGDSKKKEPEAVTALNNDPSPENWKAAQAFIKKSGAKYYKIFYESGLKGKDDLRGAYVIIYDKSYKRMFRIPIIEDLGKNKIEGATKYLKGLGINNRE